MVIVRDTSRAILCPFWARFFQRPDGFWMAYCSKYACQEMEERRPGFLANRDFPRSDSCILGFSEFNAEEVPVVIKGHGRRTYTYFGALEVSDQYWEELVDRFMDWVPVIQVYDEYYYL